MSGPTVDNNLIRDLAALLDETGLSEIEWEGEGQRVRVAKHGAAVARVAAPLPATELASVRPPPQLEPAPAVQP